MRPRHWLVALAAAVVVGLGVLVVVRRDAAPPAPAGAPPPAAQVPCDGQSPPKQGGGSWQCSWSDEFEGTALSPTWELIPYGLGSACLFDDPEYVQVRDGALQLTARRLPPSHWCTEEYGLEYGGGGIQTDTFAQQYGRFEMRARLPAGSGLWPAFWLLPADDSYGGEIDVLEVYGGRDQTGDATLHVPANGPGPKRSCPIRPDPYGAFHTYRVEWSANRMVFSYDDQPCAQFTGLSDAGTAPPAFGPAFDKPYRVLLDLAVQPWWPPDGATVLPSTMSVDYVRVWK